MKKRKTKANEKTEEELVLKIYLKDNATFIENHSNYYLDIQLKPVKPNKKYERTFGVPSKFFQKFDEPIDLTEVIFSLENQ